jgi:hypothetical protein
MPGVPRRTNAPATAAGDGIENHLLNGVDLVKAILSPNNASRIVIYGGSERQTHFPQPCICLVIRVRVMLISPSAVLV